MDNTLEQLAYEAALRTLDKQAALVDDVRTRAGLLVAASSLGVSVLARPALDAEGGAFVTLGVLALLAFALSMASSVYIVIPKEDLVFSLDGRATYERLLEFRGDLREVHRRLAYQLDLFWDQNDRTIARLLRAFRIAVLALAVEIVLLLAAAVGATLS